MSNHKPGRLLKYAVKSAAPEMQEADVGWLESYSEYSSENIISVHNEVKLDSGFSASAVVIFNSNSLLPIISRGEIISNQHRSSIVCEYATNMVNITANTAYGEKQYTFPLPEAAYDYEQIIYILADFVRKRIPEKRFLTFNPLNCSLFENKFQILGKERIRIKDNLFEAVKIMLSISEPNAPNQYMFFKADEPYIFLKSFSDIQIIELI